jgi:hypothetical protein
MKVAFVIHCVLEISQFHTLADRPKWNKSRLYKKHVCTCQFKNGRQKTQQIRQKSQSKSSNQVNRLMAQYSQPDEQKLQQKKSISLSFTFLQCDGKK